MLRVKMVDGQPSQPAHGAAEVLRGLAKVASRADAVGEQSKGPGHPLSKDWLPHLDSRINTRGQSGDRSRGFHEHDIPAAAVVLQAHRHLVLTDLQCAEKIQNAQPVKLQKTVLDVERTRNVTNFEFVGNGQKQEAIPFGVHSCAAELDSTVEAGELLARHKGRSIHSDLGANLSFHLCFIKLKAIPV